MNYFENITTLDGLKNEFRTLSKKLHPDTSGYNSQSDFVKMYAIFKQLSKKLKFKTGFEADQSFDADKFNDIVNLFNNLSDININFVGSWIWLEDNVNGAMYEQKEIIKGITINGYNTARWAAKKKSWHYAPLTDKKAGYRGKKTLSEIKSTYGCNTVNAKKTNYLSA